MVRFALRRLLLMGPLLVVIVTSTFIIVIASPGSPFSTGARLSAQVEANLKARYGLDQPFWRQYVRYMARLAGFTYDGSTRRYSWRPYPDFGDSLRYTNRTVNSIIAEAFPISAVLGLTAYLIALMVGVAGGILAAVRQRSWVDHTTMMACTLGVAVPSFVLGPLLVMIFSLTLYWLPPARVEWAVDWGWLRLPTLRTVALPVTTLAAVYVAYLARLTRSGMVDALHSPALRAARAKGVPERRLVLRHALALATLPLISFSGPALAFLITGTVVVERVFAIPGLGRYFIDAVLNRDDFLILGLTAFGGVALMIANLMVDLLLAWMDPRIRYDEA
jgi:oligopeptide transport system permease protein